MATRLALDKESVAALEPGEKDLFVWDEEVPGFGVRVFPSGTKSWIVRHGVVASDGKTRERRVTIGRCEDMSLKNARAEAVRLLGGGSVGQDETPAPAEVGEPGVKPGVRSEAAPAVALAEGEVMNPETGEILQVGADGEGEDLEEEDLELDNWIGGQQRAREPVGTADTEEHEKLLARTLDGVVAGAGRATGEGMDDEAVASGPEEVGPAGSNGEEAEARPADGGGWVEPDERGSRLAEGEHSAGGGERPGKERPERVERVRDAVAGAAGAALGLGRKVVEAGRAKRQPAEAGKDESGREPEEAPGGGDADRTEEDGGGALSDDDELEGRRSVALERVTEAREASGLKDETVAGLAQSVEGVRGMLDRIEAWGARMSPQLEAISGSVEIAAMDGRRDRRRRLASVALILAALLAGVVVGGGLQSRIEVLPRADPTGGWKDHVWEQYGPALVECYRRAHATGAGRTDCALEVRAR